MASDIFDLQGAPAQVAIVEDALRRCNFPFELLKAGLKAQTGRDRIPVEWADLSRYAETVAAQQAAGGHAHVHEGDDTGHPIAARERVLGLAWYSGKITIDAGLEREPELAAEVAISEIAHMVDFFYMTEAQRQGIFNALHGSEADVADHGHDWFDKGGYETWAGEAFMGLFVRAFSDVQMTMPFSHTVTPYAIDRTRELLLPVPVPPASPEEEVFGLARSSVFHRNHAGITRELTWSSPQAASAAGRRPCKSCKPA